MAASLSQKFSIYAGLGVPELWRYDGRAVEFYELDEDQHVRVATSRLFPFLTPEAVAAAIEQGDLDDINSMRQAFRQWVQANKPQ